MSVSVSLKLAISFLFLAFFSVDASAGTINSANLLDDILNRYSTAASGWSTVVTSAATWLFWTLVLISMVWTFGMLALRKADIGEFFAEFFRFIIFVGFFWWLLINAPTFAISIFDSLRQVAGDATGLGSNLTPSGIVDIGFAIFYKVIDQSSILSPVDSIFGMFMAVAILVVLAIVGVNMLLLLASAWILAYAGIFFLGFGGSRWTSDMAINYYKTVLGVAAQLMAMVFLVGIGKTFLDDYYALMGTDDIDAKEMGVMLIVCVILLYLVNHIPSLISGIITGASVNGAGIGQFGVGAAVGAAGMAISAAATGGAMIASGAASAAGGAQALMAAVSKASENVSNGSDVLSSMGGGSSSGGGNSGGGSSNDSGGSGGGSPYSQAAGFGSSGGSGQSSGFMAGAAKAGKILADASANLAKGGADVAMSKAASMKGSAMSRIADTTGGKIASAIKGENSSTKTQQPSGPTFSGNSLSEGDDAQAEVAAFVNRTKGNES